MPTDANVLLLGPANITIGGVDMGYTQDASLEVTSESTEAMVAEYGTTPMKAWVRATGATLKFTLHEMVLSKWQKVFQGSALITDGVTSALGFGQTAGTPITPAEVVVTPQSQMALVGEIGTLTLWACVPQGPNGVKWDAEHQKLEVTLKAFVNTSKNSGEKLGRIGDPDVSADTTAPTVSPYAPLDDATGVSVSATINATFNEALDAGTVNTDNVQVFLGTEVGGPQTKVAGTIAYDSTLFKITFTPTAALTGATLYEVVWGSGIKNSSGVRFAGAKTSFTTT